MKPSMLVISACLILTCSIVRAVEAGAPVAPAVYTLDPASLAFAKQRIQAGDPALLPAYRQLIRDAGEALVATPFTVTAKGVTPPSGDKHDYLSMAPYWWPDPSRHNGLPYVRRDGRINPATKNDETDSKRIAQFSQAVGDLGTAYYLSGDERYAQRAALLLRTWFLDPATRMNPNLNYGQAVMGVAHGRGTGIIDTRYFWQIVDAIGLIAPSGQLSEADRAGLRQWFADYTQWLLTSPAGHDEAAARNNHGSYFDEQVIDYALFTGDRPLAGQYLQKVLTARLDTQIAANGRQPLELERTRSFHYSTFNLLALFRIARYGEQLGVDVWHYPNASRPALRIANAYLAAYAADPSSWPYKDIEGVSLADYLPLMLMAGRVYGAGTEAAALRQQMQDRLPTARDWLWWPGVGLNAPESQPTGAASQG
jgi:hypothetical protein